MVITEDAGVWWSLPGCVMDLGGPLRMLGCDGHCLGV